MADQVDVTEFDTGPPVLPALWAARWSIILTAVLAAVVGFAFSSLQPVSYQATAELLLADPRNAGVFESSGVNFLDPSRYVRNQAELAQSAPVMRTAAQLVGGRLTAEQVSGRVDVRPSVDLDLLTVTATDATAAGAAQLANAVGEAYQEVVREQVEANAETSLAQLDAQRTELQATIDRAERQLAEDPDNAALAAERDAAVAQLISVNNRTDQIAVDSALYGAGVDLFEEADEPEAPAAPQPVRNAALAGVLGALAAGGLAWWRADERATADSRNDAARILRAPLLGRVPDFADAGLDSALPTVTAPTSPPAEAYQFLAGALAHALDGHEGGASVVITSAAPTDGKTLTTINLAIAAAQDGREVLVVDADTRVRGLTRMLDLPEGPGLPGLAAGASLPEVVTLASIDDDHAIPVVPAVALGKDTAAFFRTVAFRRAMQLLVEPTDLVLIDTPPLLLASDTSAVATHADGIVVVVARGTPLRQLGELRERLDLIGTPVLGYVFTKARREGGDGYRYRYAYGYGEEPASRGGRRPRRRGARRPAEPRPPQPAPPPPPPPVVEGPRTSVGA